MKPKKKLMNDNCDYWLFFLPFWYTKSFGTKHNYLVVNRQFCLSSSCSLFSLNCHNIHIELHTLFNFYCYYQLQDIVNITCLHIHIITSHIIVPRIKCINQQENAYTHTTTKYFSVLSGWLTMTNKQADFTLRDWHCVTRFFARSWCCVLLISKLILLWLWDIFFVFKVDFY